MMKHKNIKLMLLGSAFGFALTVFLTLWFGRLDLALCFTNLLWITLASFEKFDRDAVLFENVKLSKASLKLIKVISQCPVAQDHSHCPACLNLLCGNKKCETCERGSKIFSVNDTN
jgi:hypothetical protein